MGESLLLLIRIGLVYEGPLSFVSETVVDILSYVDVVCVQIVRRVVERVFN